MSATIDVTGKYNVFLIGIKQRARYTASTTRKNGSQEHPGAVSLKSKLFLDPLDGSDRHATDLGSDTDRKTSP